MTLFQLGNPDRLQTTLKLLDGVAKSHNVTTSKLHEKLLSSFGGGTFGLSSQEAICRIASVKLVRRRRRVEWEVIVHQDDIKNFVDGVEVEVKVEVKKEAPKVVEPTPAPTPEPYPEPEEEVTISDLVESELEGVEEVEELKDDTSKFKIEKKNGKKSKDEKKAEKTKKAKVDPLSCPECGFTARSEFGLRMHIQAKHEAN